MGTESSRELTQTANVMLNRSMADADRKGRALENAVKVIEETVIGHDPAARHAPFEIATRKIYVVRGVRHEIDVDVRINRDSSYESLHVFETKNWKEPAGKNEVILLSAKVAAIGAARGYLVARRFTKDAVNQAATDPRIGLVRVTEDFSSPLDLLQPVALTSEFFSLDISFLERGKAPLANPTLFGNKAAVCCHDNRLVSLTAFCMGQAKKALDDALAKKGSWQKLEGTHPKVVRTMIIFDPGEFCLDGLEVEHMALSAKFMIHVRIPIATSRFEVEGRGRVLLFETPEVQGMPSVSVRMVQSIKTHARAKS